MKKLIQKITDIRMESYNHRDFEKLPEEVQEKILDIQFEQTEKRDVEVFKRNARSSKISGGFNWGDTVEGYEFWNKVICNLDFTEFFKKYSTPKITDIRMENYNNRVPLSKEQILSLITENIEDLRDEDLKGTAFTIRTMNVGAFVEDTEKTERGLFASILFGKYKTVYIEEPKFFLFHRFNTIEITENEFLDIAKLYYQSNYPKSILMNIYIFIEITKLLFLHLSMVWE